jgi:hypothetical protein
VAAGGRGRGAAGEGVGVSNLLNLLERLFDYFEAYAENKKDGGWYCVCCGEHIEADHAKDCIVPLVVAALDNGGMDDRT